MSIGHSVHLQGCSLHVGDLLAAIMKPDGERMAVIGFVSQKGGVGKSALARSLAREAAIASLVVKLADLDTQQGTCLDWGRDRNAAQLSPSISVESYRSVAAALAVAPSHDLLIVDGPARTSAGTLNLAQAADVIVQPSRPSLDDLRPAVREFRALIQAGVPPKRLVMALNCVGSDAETADARTFIEEAGFEVLAVALPEKVAYRLALSSGRSLTETRYPALNKMAAGLLQDIIRKVA